MTYSGVILLKLLEGWKFVRPTIVLGLKEKVSEVSEVGIEDLRCRLQTIETVQ